MSSQIEKIIKIEEAIDRFLKEARINPTLWEVERSEIYRQARNEFERAFLMQTIIVLNKELLEELDRKIQIDENTIWNEKLEQTIEEIIEKHFKSLREFIDLSLIRTFFLFLANKGGQSFIDKVRRKVIRKAAFTGIDFELKDTVMINYLMNDVDFLLKDLDLTTKNWLKRQFIEGKKKRLSSFEIAEKIREKIPETYSHRAEAIVQTETENIVNNFEFETAKRNGATAKRWVTAGLNICPLCLENEKEGWIGIDALFKSKHLKPPAHVNCKCLLEYQIPPYIEDVITETGGIWTGGEDTTSQPLEDEKIIKDREKFVKDLFGVKNLEQVPDELISDTIEEYIRYDWFRESEYFFNEIGRGWFVGERQEAKKKIADYLKRNPKLRLSQLSDLQRHTHYKGIPLKEFLNKEITVYRGVGEEYNLKEAMKKPFESFTLDRKEAESWAIDYAKGIGEKASVIEAKVKVIDILGFENMMNEKEVLIEVSKLKDIKIKTFIVKP